MMLIDGEDPAEAWSIKLQNNHIPEVDMGKKINKKKISPILLSESNTSNCNNKWNT